MTHSRSRTIARRLGAPAVKSTTVPTSITSNTAWKQCTLRQYRAMHTRRSDSSICYAGPEEARRPTAEVTLSQGDAAMMSLGARYARSVTCSARREHGARTRRLRG
eukprot:2290286-Rhodomonas_salina.3